jgi:hypothetical protein
MVAALAAILGDRGWDATPAEEDEPQAAAC